MGAEDTKKAVTEAKQREARSWQFDIVKTEIIVARA
jgi:hypothetical protein